MSLAVNIGLTELVTNIAGTIVVVTGVVAGSARTWAVLAEGSHDRVERMTAVGFVVGAAITLCLVVIDSLLELQ